MPSNQTQPPPTIAEVLDVIRSETTPGEKFTLRDLYPAIWWNRIDKNDRLNLGRFFYDYIKRLPSYDPNRIVKNGVKNSSNQQVYERI